MTSQRLVEDFARWLWQRDTYDTPQADKPDARVPDSYMNEAAVFLAGELGQRLQHGERATTVDELVALPEYSVVIDRDNDAWQFIDGQWEGCAAEPMDSEFLVAYGPLTLAWQPTEEPA